MYLYFPCWLPVSVPHDKSTTNNSHNSSVPLFYSQSHSRPAFPTPYSLAETNMYRKRRLAGPNKTKRCINEQVCSFTLIVNVCGLISAIDQYR